MISPAMPTAQPRIISMEDSTVWKSIMGCCTGETPGLEVEMVAVGEVTELFGNESDEGWGHHGRESVVVDAGGRYWHATCGGCSCGGSGQLGGPYQTRERAMENVPTYLHPGPAGESERA